VAGRFIHRLRNPRANRSPPARSIGISPYPRDPCRRRRAPAYPLPWVHGSLCRRSQHAAPAAYLIVPRVLRPESPRLRRRPPQRHSSLIRIGRRKCHPRMWSLPVQHQVLHRRLPSQPVLYQQARCRRLRQPPVFPVRPYHRAPRLRAPVRPDLLPALPSRRVRLERVRSWASRKFVQRFRLVRI
jgi:hypothetical protein